MKHFGLWIALGIGVLLTIFAIENMAVIEVSFLGLDFKMRRIALIIGAVIVGFALGKTVKLRK